MNEQIFKKGDGKTNIYAVPSGTYTFDEPGNYVPGRILILKNNKLYEGEHVISPYLETVKLIERRNALVFCSINGNSFFTFRIRTSPDGKESISTACTFYKNVNDSLNRSYEIFISMAREAEAVEAQKVLQSEKLTKVSDFINKRGAKASELKKLKLSAQNKLKLLVLNQPDVPALLKDKEVTALIDQINKLHILLQSV